MIVQTKSLYVGYAHASGDCALLEDLNLSIEIGRASCRERV